MSQNTAPEGGGQDTSGTMHTAAQEASALTGTAKDAAHDVAHTGAGEAKAVAGEAKDQLKGLVSQTGRQLSDQASTQQQRLADGFGAVGGDLSRMADADESGGLAGELVRRAAGHVSTVGSWLGDRDPQQLLHEVTGFARRRPGTFIAVAALAGIVIGRLSRSIAAGSTESGARGDAIPSTGASAFAAPSGGSSVGPGDAAPAGSLGAADPSAGSLSASGLDDTGLDDGGVDDTGLVAGVDGGDPPVYAESAARLDSAREGMTDDRPGTV